MQPSVAGTGISSLTSEKRNSEKSISFLSNILYLTILLPRKIGDAEAEGEVDPMLYVNQAKYELK